MDLLPFLGRFSLLFKGGIFLVLWAVESVRPFFPAQKTGRIRHAVKNISMALINVALLGLFVKTITVKVALWTAEREFGLLQFLNLSGAVEFVLAILLIDCWMYIWHRANHQINFLWRFHRMHHTDLALDVTSASRFHPGEILFSALLRSLLIPILGLELAQILVYEVILMPVIMFHHSNVAIPEKIDQTIRCLIVTPRMHWVHHSEIRKETDSNFSSVFSFWDRLAGSFRIRRDTEKIRYGVDDKKAVKLQTLPEMLKTPLA